MGAGGAAGDAPNTSLSLSDQLRSASPEYLILVALAALGFLVLLSALSRLLRGIWCVFLRPGKNLSHYGKWAVVTGCTDGIGRGFALELARKKLSVVLISRNQAKLVELAQEIESKYKVETRVLAVDFTEGGELQSIIDRVEATLSDLDVGILINNVGLSYPHAQYLNELDVTLIGDLIRVNVEVTTRLTRLVIPGMLKKRRGAIVNVGSGAATVLPSDPLYAVYAGTKGFVDQFSRTLAVEYKQWGIDVQCQAPLYVATKMSKIRRTSLTCPSANAYARSALSAIGYESRVTPYWAHAIMWWIVASLPEQVMDTIRLKQNLGIRKKALNKHAQKKIGEKKSS
eukprot:TRINITY_DN312_c0_g1_i1.p1 TRINITY_DN312_c0_g1~~TRINITY_DN312_c0_g1_i1.p1  ORF type:complete len:343 (+),score=54.11 TRINITY_DN312_c0_g1_i1:59-1087(+)